jgi:OPA family glycerol-3-phosphate transporter-like MFS transporter
LRERGFFTGIFGILIRLGLILGFLGSAAILQVLPWQWVFWIPAACIAILFVLNFLFVRDTPADAGLGEFDTGEPVTPGERSSLVTVFRKVFASSTMWTIAAASMMIGFVRRSVVDDWWPKYFVNVHHADAKFRGFLPHRVATIGIAAAGIAGGLVFGLASDRIFRGRRAPVVVIAFGGQVLVLGAFALADRAGAGPMAAALSLVALSFFVNGAHGMIGGASSMDFGGRKAAATAAGLFDGMQYVAGSVVGIGMGRLLDRFGWSVWQVAPIPFAVVGALVMSRLWNVLPAARAAPPESAPAARAAGGVS